MSTKTKKCPVCVVGKVVKRGIQNGLQTYWCKSCGNRFRSERKKKISTIKDIFNNLSFRKQTVRELVDIHQLNKKTISSYIHNYEVEKKIHTPRGIYLVVDATYFGKRKEGSSWGVILFRDSLQKENLWWKFVKGERVIDYMEGKGYLEDLGYTIKSVTADGFLGLPKLFSGIPFQICQFHTKKTCIKYLTNNPQTEAGQVLLAIVKTIPKTNYLIFKTRLQKYLVHFNTLLNEKTYHPSGEWSYTYDNIRSTIHTLSKYIDYLFTYEKDLLIPKTSNSCEGHFSHIKDVLRIHRGMSRTLKEKVIHHIFLNSSIVLKKETN
jgi:transcription elongation factor Elf1